MADTLADAAVLDPDTFRPYAREVTFAPGAVLRTKGLLSIDMYVLLDGEVEVALAGPGQQARSIRCGRGMPIGEIGFLTGVAATATVTATAPTRALYIDNMGWSRFESSDPAAAAAAYRRLAEVAEGRQSYNLVFAAEAGTTAPEPKAEVRLCQSQALLEQAQRLRYEVYCEELGRSSPHGDPLRRLIADDLDATAYVLLAFEDASPIATMRMNMARDGNLGVLEELYGMASSALHPEATGVCTKFIVRKESRLGQSSFRLMGTAIEMAQRYGVRHCFIDCIPSLLPFYKGLGFAQAGPPFLHRENGRSYPLMLDLDRYAGRVARLTGFALRT